MTTAAKKQKTKTDLSKQSTAPFNTAISEHAINKIMLPENGLREIFKNAYGVEIRTEKQRLSTKNTTNKKTVNNFVISGSTVEKRKAAKSTLVKVLEDIISQEKEAFKFVLETPKKFAKKIDLLFTDEQTNILTQDITNHINTVRPSTQNHKLKDKQGDIALAEVKTALGRLKTALISAQSAQNGMIVRELLDNAIKSLPRTEGLPEYYTDKIEAITADLDKRIIVLDEVLQEHYTIQATAHTEAKHKFTKEERDEYRETIALALNTKSIQMDADETEVLLSSALFEMDNIKTDKLYLSELLQSIIAPPVLQVVKSPVVRKPTVAKSADPYVQFSLVGGKYVPNTQSQVEQVKAMQANGLTIVIGDAGTGKSLASIAYALDRLKEEKKKILIVRPMVELGNKDTIGFLPGGELEKIGPGFRPILKNLLKLTPRNELKKYLGLDEKKSPAKVTTILDTLLPTHDIQILPLAMIRGDTFDDYTIIVEEAQNLTVLEAESIITRAGKNTQIILAGDKIQTDLETKDRHGRWLDERQMPALPILLNQREANAHWMGVVIHPEENVVRSELVRNAVGMFGAIRKNKEQIYEEAFKGYGKESVQKIAIAPANNNSKANTPVS